METRLGRIPAECERPEPLKFAWPLILLPELFTTARHLAVARGYFASIGWEVYAPDLRAVATASRTDARESDSSSSAGGFDGLVALLAEALAALGRDAIVIGHGLGGLLALGTVEQPRVRAAVALAPMLFSKGVGGEIISAMALPVLGGLLIADEVVDIFLPVRFYWVRRGRWLKLQEERARRLRAVATC